MILLHSNGLFEQENWFKKYTFLYVAYIQILVMMELKTCKYFFNFKNILPVNVAEAKIARVHVNLWNIQETWLSKSFWSNLSICKINNATKHILRTCWLEIQIQRDPYLWFSTAITIFLANICIAFNVLQFVWPSLNHHNCYSQQNGDRFRPDANTSLLKTKYLAWLGSTVG